MVAPPQQVLPPGPPIVVGGKPGVVFVSEGSCPFCAAERWAVVVALSHFGAWAGLGATTSAADDVYPGTATFSFRQAVFTSHVLGFSSTELANNQGRPLQPLTRLDATVMSSYDVPPYVDGSSQSGDVPFLDIDNRFVLAGAQYSPGILAGLSMRTIAAQLADPLSPVGQAVDASAAAPIRAIDDVLQVSHRPS